MHHTILFKNLHLGGGGGGWRVGGGEVAEKVSEPRFYHFVTRFPVFNDRSLICPFSFLKPMTLLPIPPLSRIFSLCYCVPVQKGKRIRLPCISYIWLFCSQLFLFPPLSVIHSINFACIVPFLPMLILFSFLLFFQSQSLPH